MAETLTGFVAPLAITLGAANVATKVNIPSFTTAIWIQFLSANGKIAYSGTDGGAINANNFLLQQDELVQLQHRGDQPIYLASATPGTIVTICAWDRSE